MRKNHIAQLGIRQFRNHCNLNRGHNFSSIHPEGGKPKDAIAIGLHQRLQESSRLRKRGRSEHSFHGNVQLVTSAIRPLQHFTLVASIDGLQPEHGIRRAPAAYDRILKNIAGRNVTIHCTITGQMMKRPGH
jgi:hypothetical protein